MTETAREQIARIRTELIRISRMPPAKDDCTVASHIPTHTRSYTCVECLADAILAIPEIKEGQELLEKVKSGKLVELANTQVKPALRIDQLSSDDYQRGYRQGQYEMESAGFRRVKEKG